MSPSLFRVFGVSDRLRDSAGIQTDNAVLLLLVVEGEGMEVSVEAI